MTVIGLTGGIGTGKSTVARLLRERGVPVVDADVVAREVVEPGRLALAEIAARFGPTVLQADGTLDRAALRARISRDPDARRALEAITHPRILAAIEAEVGRLAADGHPFAVVEAALMIETGSYRRYAATIVVTCDPEQQLARVVARDGKDPAEARALMAAQWPIVEKERVADYVIRNDGDLHALEAQVTEIWGRITRR